jgi:exodeoxyribonuclease VII small subunit
VAQQKTPKKSPSMPRGFEQKLDALEKLVGQLEQGTLSLENSLESFEYGMRLVKACEAELKTAEQRVRVLSDDGGERDFDPSIATGPGRDESVKP